MGNWFFLMLLYAFFGWMKKRQKINAQQENNGKENLESEGVVEFGKGILNALIGNNESPKKKDDLIEDQAYYSDEYLEPDDIIEVPEEVSDEKSSEISIKKTSSHLDNRFSSQEIQKPLNKRSSILSGLIDLDDPVKTGVIFKEIFDKPKALRRNEK